ncbi:hypothetical protein LPJ66_001063 [Kickxella alabastrina]|uniref:Uncharacterized protein n=1 Tax=Kickxella alabastrina TaxID=61397 RepID=A0ACC1IU79_9FUNG|nr:hypothetical protein LPJ66_001063 [Kickxella alabastrina]
MSVETPNDHSKQPTQHPKVSANNSSSQGPLPKQEVPATRLFKILNPELYMKPNRFIMYSGVLAMAGIVYWLGSNEMEHRRHQHIINTANKAENGASASAAQPRHQTYQERMAELKRWSTSSS